MMNLFKSKKVLFILKELKMEHLGVMYLISALKQAGHQPYIFRNDVDIDIIEKIKNISPDYLCYSVCSGLEKYYINLDNNIHELLPLAKNMISVFGGPAVTFNPELFKNKVIIRGEAEIELIKLINSEIVTDLKLVDINIIPPPDRELVYAYPDARNNPIKNMITRRGCRFGCTYCFNRKWNELHNIQSKDIIRLRTVVDVINEAVELKEKWQPLEMIHIMDDGFAKPLEWLREFAPLYKNKVNIPFICNINPHDITEEVLKLLSEAGCQIISLANESANDENRHKILNRSGSKELIKNAVNLCKKYNIRTRLQNIIGLPIETALQDAYETLDFNIECAPTTSWCAILQCYKGTKIFEIAKSGGYTTDEALVDEGFFGISTLKLKDRVLIERLHKLWPLITTYPKPFRWLAPVLIRLPFPLKWYMWCFNIIKKRFTEKNLWKVYVKK